MSANGRFDCISYTVCAAVKAVVFKQCSLSWIGYKSQGYHLPEN